MFFRRFQQSFSHVTTVARFDEALIALGLLVLLTLMHRAGDTRLKGTAQSYYPGTGPTGSSFILLMLSV